MSAFFQSKASKGLVFYTKIGKTKKKLRISIVIFNSSLRSQQPKLQHSKVGDLESSFDKIEFCSKKGIFDRSYNFSTVVFSFNYSQPLKYFSF